MRLIDDKGRIFGKLNLFDLVVILLIVVGILGICLRGNAPSKEQVETNEATYTLELTGVQEHVVKAFKKGDQIWENGTLLGVLAEEPVVTPHRTAELQPDGTVKMVDHVMYYSAVFTLKTDQFRADKGYHIDTNEMLNGTGHVISNGFATASVVVTDIAF